MSPLEVSPVNCVERAQSSAISLRYRHSIQSPGRAVTAVRKKKIAHPTDSTTYPDVGATKILPRAASEDRRAYWVAVYRWSQRAINRATNAAVPIPPQTFSKATVKTSIA